MYKKNTVVILLLLVTLGITSCNKDANKLIDSNPVVTPTAGNVISNTNINELNSSNYQIQELNYTQNGDKIKCVIKYPEISGLSDNEMQKKVNSILKNEALKVLKYYEKSEGALDLTINYDTVLKNVNILSIQYSGVGFVTGAAHPNSIFYTTNINIQTGNRLRLIDIVNIDDSFVTKFLNGEFKALRPKQADALNHLSKKFIQDSFNGADSLDNIGTMKQSDVFSYLTTDSLGISISVGHALGDHAEFEIKYQDLKDNIKNENQIWKDLLH